MGYKVGRITLATALIGVGAVLVYDNLLGTTLRWSLFQLWPALLILLGLEWILFSALQKRTEADSGAIALLIIGMVILGAYHTAWQTANSIRWNLDWPRVSDYSPAPVTSAEFTQTYELNTLPPETHLVVNGGPAAIIVRSGEKSQLELVTKARAATAEAAQAAAQRASLRLEPGTATKATLELAEGVNFATVTIRVTVPESVRLTLSNTTGYIEVINRKGDVTASTISGAMKIEAIEGKVDLRSSSGSIGVRDIRGSVSAISSSGSIRVDRVSGDVEASATSGSLVVVDAGGKVTAHSSSGAVGVEARAVGGDYDLGAVSGSVRLTFPKSAGVRIDARTSSGTVNGPQWLIYGEGRGSATGTQGDGSYKLTARTTSGSIFLADR